MGTMHAQALDRLLDRLALSYPFFSRVASRVTRRLCLEIPSVGLGFSEDKPLLMINPLFLFEQLTEERQRMGAIVHELLHLILKHPLRTPQSGNALLWNYACDIEANRLMPTELLGSTSISPEQMGLAFCEHSLEKLHSRLEGVWASSAGLSALPAGDQGWHGFWPALNGASAIKDCALPVRVKKGRAGLSPSLIIDCIVMDAWGWLSESEKRMIPGGLGSLFFCFQRERRLNTEGRQASHRRGEAKARHERRKEPSPGSRSSLHGWPPDKAGSGW